MAELPPVQQIKADDLPRERWVERFLWPLNRFMDSVYTALSRDLTFTENMRALVRTQSFVYEASDLPLRLRWDLTSLPTDLWITRVRALGGAAQPSAAVWARWSFDGQNVLIEQITGLTGGDRYELRFIIASN